MESEKAMGVPVIYITKYVMCKSIVAMLLVLTVGIAHGMQLHAMQPQSTPQMLTDNKGAKKYSDNEFQAVALKNVLSVDLQNVTLQQGLNTVARKAGLKLVYSSNIIPAHKHVSLQKSTATLENVLWALLAGTGLRFGVSSNNHLVIMKWAKEDKKPVQQVQAETVSGIVTDAQTGETLPGVNILVKGTSTGASTGSNGQYELEVESLQDTLVVSFVGYKTQQVPIDGRTEINVALQTQAISGEEMVVVGYGTQEKENLSSSISTVNSEEIQETSAPTISQALMGKASGLFIKNVSGQPGNNDGTQFNIRGFGTPLIIIDGVPATKREFNQLNPNNIASTSVIKDAGAAAVYGARAGNGVIVIKTKRGELSEPVITYHSNYSLQHFTVTPDLVSSANYAAMENVAHFNQDESPIWSKEEIKKFKNGSDPLRYPNNDFWDLTLRKYAPQFKQNLNIRGGTEKVKYFVSGGYLYQGGMLRSKDTNDKRYNIRSNVDVSLTKRLHMGINLHASFENFISPRNQLERKPDAVGIMTAIRRISPYNLASYPDKTKLPSHESPLVTSEIDNVGYIKRNNTLGDIKLNFSYDLPWGLQAKADVSFKRNYISQKRKTAKNPLYDYNIEDSTYTLSGYTHNPSKLYQREDEENNIIQQYSLNWEKEFDSHHLDALLLFEQLSNDTQWIDASRIRYNFDLDYLFAGPDLDKDNNGRASHGGREAFVSRIRYNYQNKYLLELNGRYDASPRFPSNSRWGFFPSASIGWRISEEDFVKNSLSFLSNLKIRGSYGQLGNDATGAYQYLSTYSIGSPYIYNGESNTLESGLSSNGLPNTSITWEDITLTNVGIDFGLWDEKLQGSFDYFYRKRSHVLGRRIASLPNVVGADLPPVNYEKYDNRGWEVSLDYRNKIGSVNFNVGGNVSWNREKTVFVDQPTYASEEARRRMNQIGRWTDRRWGYQTDGLFQSKEEIRNWADQDGRNNATILPGDIKKIDYNGDGRITPADQVIIGRGDTPKFTYGINIGASWRKFDLNMLWQGAGAYDFNLQRSPDFTIPFYGSNDPTRAMLKDSWTPENPWLPTNKDARWPRYRTDSYNAGHSNWGNLYGRNPLPEFWLINGAYIRLKNIKLSYSLPADITQKMTIKNLKIYLSGYNVLTFSALDFLDPEVDTHPSRTFGDYYPITGTYNIGVELQF